MAKLSEFGKLAEKHADLIDFAIVYIEEAHPIEGWWFEVWHILTSFTMTLLNKSM